MFTINQDSSCIAIGLSERVQQSQILDAIGKILHFSNPQDVIISKDNLDNPEVYDNAKIYLDIDYKPSGLPIYCMICSAQLHTIIKDWKAFLLKLSQNLTTDIFIESNDVGYLIQRQGVIKRVNYDYYFVGESECLNVTD